MLVIVCYDVSTTTQSGQKRLKKVAEICLNYGIRAQNSVFECLVEPHQWEYLKKELLDVYHPEEDSLRFYYLGSNWQKRVEYYGKNKNLNINDTLII